MVNVAFVNRVVFNPQFQRKRRALSPRDKPAHARRRAHPKVRAVTMRERSFWLLPTDKTALTAGVEANFTHFLFTDAELHAECAGVAQFSSLVVGADGKLPGNGLYAAITSSSEMEALMGRAGEHDLLVVAPTDWAQIPTENLVAAYQGSGTRLLCVTDSAGAASAMLSSLEIGVDGCVLRTSSNALHELSAFAQLRDDQSNNRSAEGFERARLIDVHPVGTGSRVCVDTCSILAEDEGLLIGSASQALFLVLSEAASAAYCPSRPFRVNAGPVHAYCLLPDNSTKYLCELRAGDVVLAARMRPDGSAATRPVVVGRAKIEQRPLLILRTSTGEGDSHREHNIFLQNAETVRVATANGGIFGMKSVSALNVGDELVLRTDKVARHIGMPIKEDLIEN